MSDEIDKMMKRWKKEERKDGIILVAKIALIVFILYAVFSSLGDGSHTTREDYRGGYGGSDYLD